MKEKEMYMLSALRCNARAKLTDLSKKLNIPLTTTFDVYHRVNKTVVKKHTTLFDFDRLHYSITVFYFVRVRREEREHFETFLLSFPAINNIYRSNDGNGFILEALFPNIKMQHLFAEQIIDQKPLAFEYHEVIEEISREKFLADPNAILDLLYEQET